MQIQKRKRAKCKVLCVRGTFEGIIQFRIEEFNFPIHYVVLFHVGNKLVKLLNKSSDVKVHYLPPKC